MKRNPYFVGSLGPEQWFALIERTEGRGRWIATRGMYRSDCGICCKSVPVRPRSGELFPHACADQAPITDDDE
jgi:hypothetical protein